MKYNNKISEKDKEEIKERILSGETYKSIGESYNVSKQRIGKIAKELKLQGVSVKVRQKKQANEAGFDSFDAYQDYLDMIKLSTFINKYCKKKKSVV